MVKSVGFAIAGGAVLGAANGAMADLTVVSNVKVTGLPAPKSAVVSGVAASNAPADPTTQSTAAGAGNSGATPAPVEVDRTYKTYFKGNKARRESNDGGSIVIYDRDADKVYTIDVHSKTYYISSFDDALENGAALPDAISSRADLTTSVDLDDANSDPDAKRTVAGIDATKLSFFGSVTATPKAAESRGVGFGGGGGRRRGGGGGSGGGGGQRGASVHYAHATLSGSVWTTDALGLLPNGKKDEKELSIAVLQQELPDASPILKPFASEMAKKKLIPVASHLSLRTYSASGQPVNYDPASNSSPATSVTADPLIVEMNVTSVDSKTPLDDAIFKLPTGYDRVDPPPAVSPLPLS